jgi:quinoprotein glucose dehydrogenase
VPQSDVPGERTSPTQPFPTKPAAFDRQGLTAEDLIDFTPELNAEALEAIRLFRTGPMFTPPSLGAAPDGTRGSLVLPSAVGGGNWEGGAYDPETHMLYVGSHTNPSVMALQAEPDFTDVRYINGGGAAPPDVRGLPVVKPPWGRITAIDMDAGAHVWRIANGPTPPEVAAHPALAGLDIPATGRATRPVTLVTKSLLFTAEGWGGRPVLRAHDKTTGELLAELELPGAVGGLPLSYAVDGRQLIVVPVAGENGAELVALALP